jgi:uncharacterized protein YukE
MEYTPDEQLAVQLAAEAHAAAKKRQRALKREADRIQKVEDARLRAQREKEDLAQKTADFHRRWEGELRARHADLDRQVEKTAGELKALEAQRSRFLLEVRKACVHEYHLPPGRPKLFYCSSNKECIYCRDGYPCDCRSCEGPRCWIDQPSVVS